MNWLWHSLYAAAAMLWETLWALVLEQRVSAWVARQQRKIDEGLISMSQGLGSKAVVRGQKSLHARGHRVGLRAWLPRFPHA